MASFCELCFLILFWLICCAGNAWAAAGMARVMGTLARSQFAKQTKSQQTDLATWMSEIHSAMYAHIVRTLLLILFSDVEFNAN